MSAHNHTHDETKDPKIYAAVLVALLILTGITVGASTIQFGSGQVSVIIAMTIATIKASLVGLFFMHLIHERAINGIILVSSLGFVALMLIFDYTEIETRDRIRPSTLKAGPLRPGPATPGQPVPVGSVAYGFEPEEPKPAAGAPGATGATGTTGAAHTPAPEHH